jgi:hypothetical protein
MLLPKRYQFKRDEHPVGFRPPQGFALLILLQEEVLYIASKGYLTLQKDWGILGREYWAKKHEPVPKLKFIDRRATIRTEIRRVKGAS